MSPPPIAPQSGRTNRYRLALTGRRHDRRYRADVDGRPIWLPWDAYAGLVELIAACVHTESGLADLQRLTVHHLRQALDEVSAGLGRQLIHTGDGDGYRLNISRSHLADHVGLTPCFAELAPCRLGVETIELLRSHCGATALPEEELLHSPSGKGARPVGRKSKRNRELTGKKLRRN